MGGKSRGKKIKSHKQNKTGGKKYGSKKHIKNKD